MSEFAFNVGTWGPGYFANMMYTSPTAPTRTSLNFKSGSDIPLHINPRYDQQALVLNTLANQQWQHEERPPGFPLGYGQPTQITALTSDHSFDIFGKNQQQFSYCYRHRYDVSRINQVQFSGQGTVVKAYIGRALPNYEVGKVVYIKAQAPSGGMPIMNMVPSLPNDYKFENFALNMFFKLDEKVITRNHRVNMQFGHEERDGGMPITPNQPFTMTIVAQKTGFEVGVNGSHFFHFNYRVPLTREMSVDMHGFPFVEKIEYY